MSRTPSATVQQPGNRFLPPAILAYVLSLGAAGPVAGQSFGPAETKSATSPSSAPAETLFEKREMPVAPWLPASTPSTPDWLDADYAPSPLIRPGLGVAAIGDNLMPSVGPSRARRGSSTGIPVGPIDVGLGVSYGLIYGSGVVNGPDRDSNTFRNALSPIVSLFAGDRWSIRYAPTATFYSADGYKDTFDHLVSLAGSASAPNWNFGLNHTTSTANTPLVETGRQTDQTTHSSGLTARWDANLRDSFSFALSQNIRFADSSPDAYSWANQNWYDRVLTDRISAGIGVGVGYDLLDPGVDMFHQRLNGRLQGTVGRKVTYSVSGGAERRDFQGSSAAAAISPLASVTVSYQALDKLSLYAGFDHSIDVSYFSDQYTGNSSVQAGATYAVSPKWSLSAIGGIRSSEYLSTLVDDTVSREDVTSFTTFTVTWRPWRRLTTALSYSYRANDSDLPGFEFDSHQVGLRVSYSL